MVNVGLSFLLLQLGDTWYVRATCLDYNTSPKKLSSKFLIIGLMYYKDLLKYWGLESGIYYNIGWLAPGENYNTGDIGSHVFDKLISIVGKKEDVNLMRGIYPCNLNGCNGDYGFVSKKNPVDIEEGIFGSFEIWIPNIDQSKIFVAPSLIIHYIQRHKYLPPKEFIDAINAFDLNANWSGKDARKLCMEKVFAK